MARGTQLIQLVTMLREEVNRAASIAVGVDDYPLLKQKLSRTQEFFYDEYKWPFLRQVFPYKPLQAGEQYYDWPTGLNLEEIENVNLWYGNLPHEIERGIGMEQYAVYNSNIGVTSEPALRWDARSIAVGGDGFKDQMEIWPIPSSNTQNIQIVGQRKLRPLIADGDVADLDDQMIVLTAAAELLAAQGNNNASGLASLAQRRFSRMKANSNAGGGRMRRMGMRTFPVDRRFPITVHTRVQP